MKSVMNHDFSMLPQVQVPRSAFNRSCGHKTTINTGYLYPLYVDEVLPGDTLVLDASYLARLNTPIYPIMDNMFLDTFYFAVPYRLVWDNWHKFMGERVNEGDSIDYLCPTVTPDANGFAAGSIYDYMGLPVDSPDMSEQIYANAFHLRAYNLIWNEWFRDQDLCDAVEVYKGDAEQTESHFELLKRCKRHDYFTSCRPWPQKGPGVELPLGSTAPIIGDTNPMVFVGLSGGTASHLGRNVGDTGAKWVQSGLSASEKVTLPSDGTSNLYADLSNASAASINSLRQAFQLQRMMERDARGGTRYVEMIRSHFGVTSPDARMQRPEYLGGTSTPIMMTEIAQTSVTAATPQGNLAAYSKTLKKDGFVKSFTEHCLIIGLVNVRADINYQQGIDRMWSRQTRADFYWPALAHLGEQAVLNKEIFCTGASTDDDVFGYQERWNEYRYKRSLVTGKMRSNVSGTLDSWHLAQDFANLPVLNESFILENIPLGRCVAVPSQPEFKMDCYYKIKHVRPMPTYSVPGLIDHL